MIGFLLQGILETRINFIAAAAGVCALTAATLVLLTRNTQIASRSQRVYMAIWVAVVTGVGVWTTHFVAMIGYRPDAALTYDLGLTAASILIGILCIGLPVGASLFFTATATRVGLGVLAGLGVAAMHLTGMSAIENCEAAYSPFVLGFGILAGIAGFVWALLKDETDPSQQMMRALGFVVGVCGLHFIAMASVTLHPTAMIERGMGGDFLSIVVAVVSLGVLAASIVATFNHRRQLAQAVAGF